MIREFKRIRDEDRSRFECIRNLYLSNCYIFFSHKSRIDSIDFLPWLVVMFWWTFWEKVASARFVFLLFDCACSHRNQVYKAYDLVELRTVALKIHELNSQWSEEKKARMLVKQFNLYCCLRTSLRPTTCVMRPVRVLFKRPSTTVVLFDCKLISYFWFSSGT